ncbi:replication protein, partial [Mannheimia haemolytica]
NQAEKALVAMAKRIMSGEQIPPPKPLIEEKKKVPIDPRIQRILDEKKQAGAMQ